MVHVERMFCLMYSLNGSPLTSCTMSIGQSRPAIRRELERWSHALGHVLVRGYRDRLDLRNPPGGMR